MDKNESQFIKGERRRLQKLLNIKLLPNYYKKIGIALFFIAFIVLVSIRTFAESTELIKDILRNFMLISILIISISSDKVEDELTKKLRRQSYTMAFIIGVLFILVQSIIKLVVSFASKSEEFYYSDLGDFQVLFFMMLIQISFFITLKRLS